MTTNPVTDFDGCRRACRTARAHTLVRGECEHAPEPEPTVSMSRVFRDVDGHNSIGFDSYTVTRLAELIEPALRTITIHLGPNARLLLERGETVGLSAGEYASLALAAADRIVHRHDPEPAVVPVSCAAPDQTAEAIASCPGRELSPNPCRCPCYGCKHHCAAHDPSSVAVPPPADRATVLREEAALLRAHCPDHLDDNSAEGAWINCHCDVADDMERRAAEAQHPGPQFMRVCTPCPQCDHTADADGDCGNGCTQPAAGVRQPDTKTLTVRELAHAIDNSTPYPVELDGRLCQFMAGRLLEMLAVAKRPEHDVWQAEEPPPVVEPMNPDDLPPAVSGRPAAATPTVGYSGKGRVWCLRCPRPDDEDVPVGVDLLQPYEECVGCGRCVVDVAATQQPAADDREAQA